VFGSVAHAPVQAVLSPQWHMLHGSRVKLNCGVTTKLLKEVELLSSADLGGLDKGLVPASGQRK
jgi:hypothetical protein